VDLCRWCDRSGSHYYLAVTFAVQEHDLVLSDEITETALELQDTGTKITSLRDADLKDMNDYIRAYSEMAPLLNDYDRHLQRITLTKGTEGFSESEGYTGTHNSLNGKTCRRF
jgi:hypothetical protein